MEPMIEAPKMIYANIAAIMGEIGSIGKNQKNAQQGFMYRGIDDVMNTLNPLFAKYSVFCVPEVLDKTREERTTQKGAHMIYTTLTVRYTFYALDGSFVTAQVVGEGMDSGDKSANKALAVAMKYAMFQTFCIPTEEMVDPDAETPPPSLPTHEPEDKAGRQSVSPEPKAENGRQSAPAQKALTRADMIQSVIDARHTTRKVFDDVSGSVLESPLDTYHGDLFREALHRVNNELKKRLAA